METKKDRKKNKLEKNYEELFAPVPEIDEKLDRVTLLQPYELRVVQSCVTYGAYEEPI